MADRLFTLVESNIVIIYQKDNLKVHQLLLNSIKTNCFIVQNGNEAVLIDPTDDADTILRYLQDSFLELKYMLSTHGHFDHISAAAQIVESCKVDKLYIHVDDFGEVDKANLYSKLLCNKKFTKPKLAMFDDDLIGYLKSIGVGIKHAGGHTKGSCFIYALNKDFMITGDLVLHHKLNITLIDRRENIGELFSFIQDVSKDFNMETVIFPGHGDMTSLGVELKNNKKWLYIKEKCNGY